MAGMIENIEEVVLAVEDQDKVVALFEDLFDLEFKDSWTVPADNMSVKCAHIGSTMFHIVSSMSENAVIARFIRDRGEGVHHIAFRVRDMDEIVTRLREKGVKLVPEDPISLGPSGPSYIFVHPRSLHGIMIELIWPGKKEG
ncbi:MAG: VOC family protein [Dehalococcoidia bacterium]|nr:VOC family protein [Dehalococcoidia bacterium]